MMTEDYLQRNRELARRFLGRRIVSAMRLLSEAADDEIRLVWGPALVELDDGRSYLFDCEESLSNLIVWQMPDPPAPIWDGLASKNIRIPIATIAPQDPLHVMLEEPITRVDTISRDHMVESDAQRYYEMCGWRVHFES